MSWLLHPSYRLLSKSALSLGRTFPSLLKEGGTEVFSWEKKLTMSQFLHWFATYSWEKSFKFSLRVEMSDECFDCNGDLYLKRGSLFLCRVSSILFVFLTSLSVKNSWDFCFPTNSVLFTVLQTIFSAMSFVSRHTKVSSFSRMGFLTSSIMGTKDTTCWRNSPGKLLVCLWCK